MWLLTYLLPPKKEKKVLLKEGAGGERQRVKNSWEFFKIIMSFDIELLFCFSSIKN